MVMPARLLLEIEKAHPPYGALKNKHQIAIAAMLWRCSDPRFAHARYPGTTALTKDQIRLLWGSDQVMRNVVGTGYFAVIAGDNLSGHANAFTPTALMSSVLSRTLDDPTPDRLIRDDGRAVKMGKKLVRSRAAVTKGTDGAQKMSVWADVCGAMSMPVNQSALIELISTGVQGSRKLAAQRILKLSRNDLCPGQIPLQYEQKSTGRIVDVLAGLQSMPTARCYKS